MRETMFLNVLPYDIVSDMFPHGSEEVSLFPKMTTPQLLLYLRKLLENLTAGYALQNPNDLRNRIPRWKRDQDVNVVFCDLTLLHLKIKMSGNLQKQFLNPVTDVPNKYLFPILRTPYKMISRFIYRMTCSAQNHADILLRNQTFLKPHRINSMRH